MKHDKHYDVIIIGGSYAGLAAGLALGRALRNILIIDHGDPCNKQTPYSHNFLTNDGKTPQEIAETARQQLQRYDSVEFLNAWATAASKTHESFEVHVQHDQRLHAKKLIVATGIKDLMPDMPGFSACWGISVLHCPYCHGYEVRGRKTGIIANGDNGFELSSLISNWTNDLTLYTNGKSTLTPQQKTKLEQHRISIEEEEIDRLEHKSGYIESITFKNGRKAPVNALYARPPFVQHSDIPERLGCELTPEGYVKIDAAQRTTVRGVFASGDNTTRMRTVANAVSMGTTAGLMVNKELIEEAFQ